MTTTNNNNNNNNNIIMTLLTMSTTSVVGSEVDATTPTTNSPTKSRKSFGISRKASAMRLINNEKYTSTHPMPTTPAPTTSTSNPKDKKSTGFLSYFFRPFRSQKSSSSSSSKKIPHTTALEQSEFSSQRKDSKIDHDFPLSRIPSVPSTASPARFSQALFVPPTENTLPQISASRRSSSDNPCLFLAFEQAIKSGVLTAPSIPPELIIKYHQENEARFQRERKSRFARKGSLSKSLDVGWTQKLFILTPGHLLQYGSDGSYDREPERVLKLRPDSLTFATDVFEGKHFVLQITSGADALPATPDERRPSIMSRFGSKNRFDAFVLLLVFDGAEEMQDWLVKIRKEISRLGGPNIEEHPQPASKAGTIIEEEGQSSFRKSMDSTRKHSSGGRKSDEIAASMSTTASQDGMVLEDLRANSYNSSTSRERGGSQGSLETSPERSSVPDTRRRSTVSTTHSQSSTDLRLRSRPPSTVFGYDHSAASERPPSPTLTQVSTISFGGRRSTSALPAPIPIPVPSIPKRHASTVSYVGDLPTPDIVHRRVRRHRKSSAPPSPDRIVSLLSTSLPNPSSPTQLNSRRPRPVSLASAPATPRRDSASKSSSLKRRSLGALGPPRHPPPSTPLPKLPDGTVGTFPKTHISLLSPMSAIPPVPQIPIPIPNSPLALHAQSATDLPPVRRRQSIQTLS